MVGAEFLIALHRFWGKKIIKKEMRQVATISHLVLVGHHSSREIINLGSHVTENESMGRTTKVSPLDNVSASSGSANDSAGQFSFSKVRILEQFAN